jgi:TonB family protein
MMVNRQSIALIAMLTLAAPAARTSEIVDAKSTATPVRLHQSSPEELGRCYSQSARKSGSEGSVKVTVTVGADGSVTRLMFPSGIETWQEETARCVINLLSFDPATKNGTSVPSDVIVPINFSLAQTPDITPPRLLPPPSERIGKCYAWSARRSGSEGRLIVVVTVEADGRISGFKLPAGVNRWQEETANCVMELLKFEPATMDGVAVAASAQVPIDFALIGAEKLTYPTLASTETELEEAYRACYPADELATAQPKYRATISPTGKATKVTLVESAGIESIDQAGICVMKMLRFHPARRGKEAIQSTAIMPIVLRPPK